MKRLISFIFFTCLSSPFYGQVKDQCPFLGYDSDFTYIKGKDGKTLPSEMQLLEGGGTDMDSIRIWKLSLSELYAGFTIHLKDTSYKIVSFLTSTSNYKDDFIRFITNGSEFKRNPENQRLYDLMTRPESVCIEGPKVYRNGMCFTAPGLIIMIQN